MKVIKRNGQKANYNKNKIVNAVLSAMEETRSDSFEDLYETSVHIADLVEQEITDGVDVETIQDVVETKLMEQGYHQTAKAYILYRKEREDKRGRWLDNGLPFDIWQRKYQFENESFEEFFTRVAKDNTNIKKKIRNKEFSPAGRILANRGLHNEGQRISLSNCYVLKQPDDSLESIFDTAKYMARTYSVGGGCGVSMDNLRPRGAKVNNAAKTTTGSVSFMDLYNMTSRIIGQKKRRGALMIALSDSHPDLEEFIELKTNLDRINTANTSIKISDDFMNAVKDNQNWTLEFDVEDTGEHIEKTKDADRLINKIAYANWLGAEPGALFWTTISNWCIPSEDDEFEYAGTNPCAEEPLPEFGSCLTGDTNILTPQGVRRIDSLNEDYVFSTDDKMREYLKVKEKGIQDVFELKLENGLKLEATDDHMIKTKNNGMVEIKGLTSNHKIKVLKDYPLTQYGNYDKKYEMFGWMHGDGWYTDNSIGISFNYPDGDEEVKSRLLPIFKEVFNVKERPPLKDDEVSYQLQTNKNFDFEKCKELGFVKATAIDKELPVTFYDWTLQQQISFIRGLFSADAGITGKSNAQVSFVTSSIQLANQVQKFLASLGIHTRFYENRFYTEDRNPQYKIVVTKESANIYMKTIGLIPKVKIDKFNESNYKDNQYLDIDSIKYKGEEIVYDIVEVYDTNTFYANGIAVHNCNLSSINLSEFVTKPYTKDANFDMAKFTRTAREGITFLNEVLEEGKDLHPLEQQRKTVEEWLPVGLGIFGLGSMLLKMGIRYGSQESLTFCDHLGFTLLNAALQQSALLAKEKGTYPKYKEDAVLASPFLHNNTTKETMELIKKYGLRNSAVLSIAPTGTISNLYQVSGGIEPLFKTSYTRKTESLHDEQQEYTIFDNTVKELMDKQNITNEKDLPGYVVDAHNLDYKERIQMQSVWQQYIDASISSTINLPNSATVRDIKDLYMYAWESGLKGVTIYRDGCAREGILQGEENGTKKEMTDQDWIDQNICPECHITLDMTGGCKECPECAFELCEV